MTTRRTFIKTAVAATVGTTSFARAGKSQTKEKARAKNEGSLVLCPFTGAPHG
jgi:hypothetical protein